MLYLSRVYLIVKVSFIGFGWITISETKYWYLQILELWYMVTIDKVKVPPYSDLSHLSLWLSDFMGCPCTFQIPSGYAKCKPG